MFEDPSSIDAVVETMRSLHPIAQGGVLAGIGAVAAGSLAIAGKYMHKLSRPLEYNTEQEYGPLRDEKPSRSNEYDMNQ